MKLMIDTNIFLDVFLQREPFFADSKAVLQLCENGQMHGFLPASTITDIFYLSHRFLHSNELAYQVVGHVLDIAKVLPVTNEDVLNAYTLHAPDFEDCLLAVCAKANRCDGIVTRNVKDFEGFGVTVFTPSELL